MNHEQIDFVLAVSSVLGFSLQMQSKVQTTLLIRQRIHSRLQVCNRLQFVEPIHTKLEIEIRG